MIITVDKETGCAYIKLQTEEKTVARTARNKICTLALVDFDRNNAPIGLEFVNLTPEALRIIIALQNATITGPTG